MSVSYDSEVRGKLDFDAIGTLLAGAAGLYKVGQGRPLVLVGHSLGGLALKKMCVTAWERGDVDAKMKALADNGAHMRGGVCRCVFARVCMCAVHMCLSFGGPSTQAHTHARTHTRAHTRTFGFPHCTARHHSRLHAVAGVFFYVTPQAGSFLANPGSKVFSGPMMKRLEVLDETSVNLNNEFRRHFEQVPQMGLYEKKPLSVLPKALSWLPLGVLVVPVGSACCGVDKCIPRPKDDQISICKPESRESDNYLFLKGFIEGTLKACVLPRGGASAHVMRGCQQGDTQLHVHARDPRRQRKHGKQTRLANTHARAHMHTRKHACTSKRTNKQLHPSTMRRSCGAWTRWRRATARRWCPPWQPSRSARRQ